jgi:hypothetical protein
MQRLRNSLISCTIWHHICCSLRREFSPETNVQIVVVSLTVPVAQKAVTANDDVMLEQRLNWVRSLVKNNGTRSVFL